MSQSCISVHEISNVLQMELFRENAHEMLNVQKALPVFSVLLKVKQTERQ